MSSKFYFAENMALALKQVKDELGEDALILNTTNENKGVKVEATNQPVNYIPNPKPETTYSEFDEMILSRQHNFSKKVELDNIAVELNEIKAMIAARIPYNSSLHPAIRQISQKLEKLGFCDNLIQFFLLDTNLSESVDLLWEKVQCNIRKSVYFDNNEFPDKRLKAVIGPNGVGKTHYLSKWINHVSLMNQPVEFAFIFFNHSNLKVIEEANAFARLFHVKTYYCETLDDLENAYSDTQKCDHVFLEFPGYDRNHADNNHYIQFIINHCDELDLTLLLPAGSTSHYIDQYIALYAPLEVNAISLTKCDENPSFEGAIQHNIISKIPLRYVVNGADQFSFIERASLPFLEHHFNLPLKGVDAC